MSSDEEQPRRTRRKRNDDADVRPDAPRLPRAPSPQARRIREEALGIFALLLAVLVFLALGSYRPDGPNLVGPVGEMVAGTVLYLVGATSFVFALVAAAAGVSFLRGRRVVDEPTAVFGFAMLVACLPPVFYMTVHRDLLGNPPGGLIGTLVGGILVGAVGTVGAALCCLAAVLIAAMLITGRSLADSLDAVRQAVTSARARWAARRDVAAASAETVEVTEPEEFEATAADEPTTVPRPSLPKRLWAWARSLLRRDAAAAEGARVDGPDDGDSEIPIHDRRVAIVRPATDRMPAPTEGALGDDPAWAQALFGDGALGDDAFQLGDDHGPLSRIARGDVPAAPEVPSTVGRPAPAEAAPSVDDDPAEEPPAQAPLALDDDEEADLGPVIVESAAQKQRKRAEDLDRAQQVALPLDGSRDAWEVPPLSFLRYEEHEANEVDKTKLRDLAARLERVLADFKVNGRVSGICPGPVVTLFEFEPESGTKLSRISGLSDDIAMALRAHKVRIIAPIPGKGCVGIEVPNESRETVYLKEILADDGFTRAKSKLTLALGKDIEGFPVVMDLAKSPHLLIAGTTGSGKSVSVNAMITSVLYNASPDEVKMILIDPKQLEFAIYEGTPHLLLPVVTDPAKAATALNWAVQEMERRYKLMAELRVRNLAGYNEKLRRLHEELPEIDLESEDHEPSPMEALLTRTDPDGRIAHRRMFHLVVIVDEFADLMMVAGKEVEVAVARLAQKARAAGIHVILATQRPSVDVITGLIKANFPTRISFRLMSGTDSRTVLDTIGAENLLGMGDMLYRPPGSSELRRIHGAYVDEAEIEEVVRFVHDQREPEYDESILAVPEPDESEDADSLVDARYDEAVAAVVEAGFASISMLQRKLQIGYNRSARIVEEMERQGVIGPQKVGGASRRDVLVSSFDHSPAP